MNEDGTHKAVNLSIHDLTRRSTYSVPGQIRYIPFQFTTSRGGRPACPLPLPIPGPFNSRPHEEVDLLPRQVIFLRNPFNSRPHEEVDPGIVQVFFWWMAFNSRPHEEVDQFQHSKKYRNIIFQFTTSRGGRRS